MVGDLWPPQRVGRLGPGAGVSMTTEVDVLLGRDGVDRLPEAIGPPISITVLMTGCLCAGDNDCVAISAREFRPPWRCICERSRDAVRSFAHRAPFRGVAWGFDEARRWAQERALSFRSPVRAADGDDAHE